MTISILRKKSSQNEIAGSLINEGLGTRGYGTKNILLRLGAIHGPPCIHRESLLQKSGLSLGEYLSHLGYGTHALPDERKDEPSN